MPTETFNYDLRYYEERIGGFHSASYPIIIREFERYAKGAFFESILDLGCGDGFYGPFLRDKTCRLEGVDRSEAVKDSPRFSYYDQVHHHDLGAPWAAGDRRYDLLWSVEVIEHVEDYQQFLRNAHRVLKPGGVLFLTTTTYFWTIFVLLVMYRRQISWAALAEFTRGWLGSEEHRCRFVKRFWDFFTGHYHGFTRGQLKNAFLQAGFRVDKMQYLHIQPVVPIHYLDQPYGGSFPLLAKMGIPVLRNVGRCMNFLCRSCDLYAPNILVVGRKDG